MLKIDGNEVSVANVKLAKALGMKFTLTDNLNVKITQPGLEPKYYHVLETEDGHELIRNA